MSLPGFKVLLVGESGSGKTHAIRSLLRTGIQPIVLATEPGMRSLAKCRDPKCSVCAAVPADAPPIPWAYVSPQAGTAEDIRKAAELINTRDLAGLCNFKDGNRKMFNQFIEVAKLNENFVDSTGRSWGNVGTWNTDRCLVIDGLSSLGDMAMDSFVGRRPAYDKGDYGVAQRAVKNMIVYWTCQMRAHVVLVAHITRGQDEAERAGKITVNTVGQKLAPELPRLFDDMPYATRDGTAYSWDTALSGTVMKARNLPIASKQAPDFKAIVDSWKEAGGVVESTLPFVKTEEKAA